MGTSDETKRTNEIGTVVPCSTLELDLTATTVTTDALLTQRTLAHYLHRRGAHFVFCVKANHPTVLASPQRLLALNRGHWCVESAHHILDTAFDEDRCRIRTGHGPENTSRLRRFAIGLIRAHSHSVAATLRKLQRNTRLVFDYLKLTRNTLTSRNHAVPGGRTN